MTLTIIQLLESGRMVAIRSSVLLALSAMLTITGITQSRAEQVPGDVIASAIAEGLSVEHRITNLEGKTDTLIKEVDNLRAHDWMNMLALAGLVGEAGIRAVKGRRSTGK